ncbi:MAG TPA: hypothetical protein VNT99_16100 [Methylomirabilota bacterium]|nr:hypothetical protein [Methylomirabilota bacterium]
MQKRVSKGMGLRNNSRVLSDRRITLATRKGLSWIPWQAIVGRIARGHGFIDPGLVLKRLRAFAKPSEVGEPIELLRAGVVFHARGLVNTRAFQFNLDWIWPYWVEQQFNPNSDSFIPRAFSFSHINLTHRNWTAVGLPDVPHYPIVDPRGLVTPLFDGWSLDFWLIGGESPLLPSKCEHAEQSLDIAENISVQTRVSTDSHAIESRVTMERDERSACCVIRVSARGPAKARLVIAVRPYNPEGVSFVDAIELASDRRSWSINGVDEVKFSRVPERVAFSCYQSGDVFSAIDSETEQTEIECSIGMATAAAIFAADTPIELRIPIEEAAGSLSIPGHSWREELETCMRLQVPDDRLQRLYDTAVSTVILHCPGEVYPGPYTYKRFWYRDAALILNAVITMGARDRARRALERFPRGQLSNGYFRSQEGEWDSNGQVLWILDRYFTVSGEPVSGDWQERIERGAQWIIDKRMDEHSPHPGLLPAGFSAEHLGPNDFYFWDDFWGVAGLRAAARMLTAAKPQQACRFNETADEFLAAIVAAVERALSRTGGAIPAAPDRRMDSGAVGSLVADFPLQLFPAGDARMLGAIEWLLANSFVRGGFFQNMIHSGINAYLTLHVAQVMLRAGDQRLHQLIDATAALASPTGQWPEAIHPRTLGGCMGDGQHVWAAAEWIVMMRNLFVREEGDALVIGGGIRPEWIQSGRELGIERTLSPHGEVSVSFRRAAEYEIEVVVRGSWRAQPPRIEMRVPGYTPVAVNGDSFRLRRV